jgi:hypothetical protein
MIKKDWNKEIKKLFSFPGIDKEKKESAPSRDWRIIVLMSAIVFVLSLAFHGYLFMRVNDDSLFAVTVKNEEPVAFNKENFERILNIFDQQDTTFEKLKNEPLTAVDPSL